MAWTTITLDDVKAALSAAETSAISSVSVDVGQSDPITKRIQYTTDMIRGYIRRRFPVGVSGVPAGLVDPALSIIIYHGLMRVAPQLAEKRKPDFDAAMKILDDVKAGDWAPEEPTTETTETGAAPSPSIVGADDDMLTQTRSFDRASQEGI